MKLTPEQAGEIVEMVVSSEEPFCEVSVREIREALAELRGDDDPLSLEPAMEHLGLGELL